MRAAADRSEAARLPLDRIGPDGEEGSREGLELMASANGPTHAGGVVYRLNKGVAEFLIVTARRRPGDWVLPKGHLERGESPEETAIREVQEESGVVATIVEPLPDLIATINGERQRIRFFLMSRVREGVSSEGRGLRWLPCEQAMAQLTFEDLRSLIDRARTRVEETISETDDTP